MNVASKIILVNCLVFVPLMGVHTWMSIERQRALFLSDMERDLSVLGTHLREVAVAEWRRSGAGGVAAVLNAASKADDHIKLEWKPSQLGTRGLMEEKDFLTWSEPVQIDEASVGTLVLSEPLSSMHNYLRSTLVRLGLLTLLLVSTGLLVVRFLGHRLIGRRLNQLVSFAAETGAGRFGLRVDVGGEDEITCLGESLGEMSEMLDVARKNEEAHVGERLAMLNQLRHADRLASLGRLAGSVAHELGTPLNVVLGHANRISEGTQIPSETKDSAATIHRQVKRMETIIRDILGFARSKAGEMKRIDLNNVANDVCLLLRPLARQRRIQLELDVTLAAAPVQGRDVQLEQALSNVIANAIDASPEGGRISISLSLETRKSETSGKRVNVVAVRVRDQGPGVPEAEVARLFEPFYTSKVPGEGTGLGLWLTDGIVRDHGGSIEVENGTDGGACFALVFPTIDVEGKVS